MVALNRRYAGGRVAPGITLPLFQQSKFLEAVHSLKILESGVNFVYFPQITSASTPTAVSKIWRGNVDEVQTLNGEIEVPVYNIQARTAMIINEAENFNKQVEGASFDFVLDHLARQGVNARDNFLTVFGAKATANQGLYGGSTVENLPADTATKTKVSEYNVNELFAFIKGKIVEVLNKTYNYAQPFYLMGTYQFINYLRSTYIPVTDYQKDGAGVATIAEALEAVVAKQNGAGLILIENDLLLAANSGLTTDIFIVGAKGITDDTEAASVLRSELKLPNIPNAFVNSAKCEMNGTVMTPNPIQDGQLVKNYELFTTPGIVLREGTTVSVTYTFA